MKTILLVLAVAGVASDAYAQDAASGEKVFAQCRACHQVGPNAKNAVGPVLNGLMGRKAGTYEGYTYSQAMKDPGKVADLLAYLKRFDANGNKVP